MRYSSTISALILSWIEVQIITGHVTLKSCHNFSESNWKQPRAGSRKCGCYVLKVFCSRTFWVTRYINFWSRPETFPGFPRTGKSCFKHYSQGRVSWGYIVSKNRPYIFQPWLMHKSSYPALTGLLLNPFWKLILMC